MDRELAKLVAVTAFRSSADINNLVPLLKECCNEAEYKAYALAIASASAEISMQILNKIYEDHPDIKDEFEEKMHKYGRIF